MNQFTFFVVIFLITAADGCIISRENFKPVWSEQPKHVMSYPMGPNEKPVPQWGPFRINASYGRFYYVDKEGVSYHPSMTATTEQRKKLFNIIKWVIFEVKRVITAVRRLETPVRIPRHCIPDGSDQVQSTKVTQCHGTEKCTPQGMCFDMPVADEYSDACYVNGKEIYGQGNGFADTDLMLLFTIANCTSGQLAGATLCQREPTFNTPVAGFIRFCAEIFLQKNVDEGYYRALVMHELLHVLLDPLNGEYYVDEDGRQRHHTYRIENRRWKSLRGDFFYSTMLSTLPTLVKFAKDHFNCPQLLGLELENDTTPGLTTEQIPFAFMHFEERLFPDALLSPVMQIGKRLTKLELAVLKDTGWYRVNETYDAVELKATRNKGCQFAMMSCYEYTQYVNFDKDLMYPYCNDQSWYCSPDGRSSAFCNMVEDHVRVPDMFKYYNNYSVTIKQTEYCAMVNNRPQGNEGYPYHEDPLCFSSDSYYRTSKRTCVPTAVMNGLEIIIRDSGGVCHEFRCLDKTVELWYKNLSFTCKSTDSGRRKNESGTGSSFIFCPKFSIVCDTSSKMQVNNVAATSVVGVNTVVLIWFASIPLMFSYV